MNKYRILVYDKIVTKVIILTFIVPQTVYGNAGTALMWVPIYQLLYGNLLLGVIEGVAISLLCKTKLFRSVLIMILGNYVSWIVGTIIISLFQEYIIGTLLQLQGVFVFWVISLIIFYLLTVVIELPFYNWTFLKEKRNWKNSWKLSFFLNLFTYTTMIIIYLNVSEFSFFTALKVNQNLLQNKSNFELVIKKDGNVFAGKISEHFNGEMIYHIPEKYVSFHFALKENTTKEVIDLVLVSHSKDTLSIIESFIRYSDKMYYTGSLKEYNYEKSDFRDSTDKNWEAYSGNWAIEGLTIESENKNRENYAYEVPWMFWHIGQISILNESELICNFNGRLILVNKNTKEVAFITNAKDYLLRKASK